MCFPWGCTVSGGTAGNLGVQQQRGKPHILGRLTDVRTTCGGRDGPRRRQRAFAFLRNLHECALVAARAVCGVASDNVSLIGSVCMCAVWWLLAFKAKAGKQTSKRVLRERDEPTQNGSEAPRTRSHCSTLSTAASGERLRRQTAPHTTTHDRHGCYIPPDGPVFSPGVPKWPLLVPLCQRRCQSVPQLLYRIALLSTLTPPSLRRTAVVQQLHHRHQRRAEQRQPRQRR